MPVPRSRPVYAPAPLDAAAMPPEALPRLHAGALVLRLGDAGQYAEGRLGSGAHSVPVRALHAAPGVQLLQLLSAPEQAR